MYVENNIMKLVGEIVTDFEFNNEVYDEKFYKAMFRVIRDSGVEDIIPIVVSEKLLDMSYSWVGVRLELSGQYRSYARLLDDGHRKIELFMFVNHASYTFVGEDVNHIELDGYLCKEPYYRQTPKGRHITEIILAVNRAYGKTDYIPLICWSRDAALALRYSVGTHVKVVGRVQSREYIKTLEDGTRETRVAYEVSVADIWEV